jgi:hypothetical protein
MSNEFNLEWAKRGSMFWACDKNKSTYSAVFCPTNGAVVVKAANEVITFYPTLDDFLRVYAPIQMATRYECAEEGAKYIEPPVDVEALQKRIDALEQSVKNLHKVKGRHHTQQALESLFKLVGVENNIGESNGSD